MEPDAVLKEEVTVTAQFIEHKNNGNLFIKIQGNPLALNANGMDMLYRIPGTWGLSVYGQEIAMIYINGRELKLPKTQWTDYLKSLDASNIKSYEFSPLAGSETIGSANGSILYIDLISIPEAGAQVTISLRESYRFKQYTPTTSPILNMAIGYKKLQTFTYFHYNRNGSEKHNINHRRYYFDENQDTTLYAWTDTRDWDSQIYVIDQSVSYEIDSHNSIEANVQGYFTPENKRWGNSHILFNNTGLDFSNFSNDTTKSESRSLGAYIGYTHKIDSLGSSLKATIEYTNYRFSDSEKTTKQYSTHNYLLLSESDYLGHGISPAIDFTFAPKNKISFSTGLRYLYTYRNTDFWQHETASADLSKPDNTQESIYAFYGNLIGNWNRFFFKAGIRIEYCDRFYRYANNAHSTLQEWAFLPSVTLRFSENKSLGHSIALSYSSRLNRPNASYLDPTQYKYGEFLILSGNANLKSSYIHSLQLRQILWNELSVVASASWRLNNVETAFTPSETDERLYYYQPVNYGYNAQYSLSGYYGKSLFAFWYLNANAEVSYLHEKTFNYGIQGSFSWNFHIYNQFLFPYNWSATLMGGYTHFGRQLGRIEDDVYSLSASVTKSFLNNRLSLSLSLDNMITNAQPESIAYMDKYISYSYDDMSQRHIAISIQYRFDFGKKEINSQRVFSSGVSQSRF